MGRPRKRRREGEALEDVVTVSNGSADTHIDALIASETTDNYQSSNALLGDQDYFATGFPDMPIQLDQNFDLTQFNISEQTPLIRHYANVLPRNLEALSESTLDALTAPSAGCTCLPNAYLALSNLQTTKSLPFPVNLNQAMSVAGEMLDCPECVQERISATQNSMLVGTLLTTIAQQLSIILKSIDTESASAEAAGTTKTFRFGETSPSLAMFHTGTADCPAAFYVELEAKEWRELTKKVVKSELVGPRKGSRCFLDVVRLMEERHDAWALRSHTQATNTDFCRHTELSKDDHLCIRIVRELEAQVEAIDWG